MSDFIFPDEEDDDSSDCEFSSREITGLCEEVLELREWAERQGALIAQQANTIVLLTDVLVGIGFDAEELLDATAPAVP